MNWLEIYKSNVNQTGLKDILNTVDTCTNDTKFKWDN